MKSKTVSAKPIVHKNGPEHPYKQYESHPYWKRIDKGISGLVEIGIWRNELLDRTSSDTSAKCFCSARKSPFENDQCAGGWCVMPG
jgi:hypothetical protein